MSENKAYTLKDLRSLAKELGIRGYSGANKARLVSMLDEHATTKHAVNRATAEKVDAPVPDSAFEKDLTKAKKGKKNAVAPESTESTEGTVSAPKTKRVSAWKTFLNEYRDEHKVSLAVAMKQSEAYQEWKAKRATESTESTESTK